MKKTIAFITSILSVFSLTAVNASAVSADMPQNKADNINPVELIKESFENTNYYEMDLEVGDNSITFKDLAEGGYTFSKPYVYYDLTDNKTDNDGVFEFFVKDGSDYICSLVLSANDVSRNNLNSIDEVGSYEREILDSGKDFWVGNFVVSGTIAYDFIYTEEDGFYSRNQDTLLPYEWGEIPLNTSSDGEVTASIDGMPDAVGFGVDGKELLAEVGKGKDWFESSDITTFIATLLDDEYEFTPYYYKYYDLANNEVLSDYYIYYVKKDGEYVGSVAINKENGTASYDKITDFEKEQLEKKRTMWLGSYTISASVGTGIYTEFLVYTKEDGFYCTNFNCKKDYTWGNIQMDNIEVTEPTDGTYETLPDETETVSSEETTTSKKDVATIGDVNLDGEVGIADAVLINKYLVGSAVLTDQSKSNADCDKDGEITPADTLRLLEYLIGTVEEI